MTMGKKIMNLIYKLCPYKKFDFYKSTFIKNKILLRQKKKLKNLSMINLLSKVIQIADICF